MLKEAFEVSGQTRHQRLTDKVAIITGAANGIGLAIGRHFVEKGANVMFADIDENRLIGELGDVSEADNMAYFAGDLRERLTVANLLSATLDAFDEVDILINAMRRFDLTDPLDRATQAAGGGLTLSPMPGLVKAVFVTAGQAVAAGDRLAVLEAMKMEHTLTAARDGTVAEVLAEAGSQVEAGVALIRLEEEE